MITIKTKENIKDEYREYKLQSQIITSEETAILYIDQCLYETLDQLKALKREIRTNEKEKLKSIILNQFSFFYETINPNLYDEDNQLLEEIIDYIMEIINFLNTIKNATTTFNYKETSRLTEFLVLYYDEQIDNYDTIREILEYSYRNIEYSVELEDNRIAFKEFLEEQIATLQKEKNLEKTKKMC